MTFTLGDLPEVRRFTEGWAWRAGISAAGITDFVIAVNEIAANAVRHGSPQAVLWLQVAVDAVTAEVRDNGRWQLGVPRMPEDGAPAAGGGMGLTIARRVCDDIHITTGWGGTAVVLRMALT
jgi:anti-sigma regulatory factor (Ser/Thr protein kinase)